MPCGQALGQQTYVINPKRCLCPFISTGLRSKCKAAHSGTVDLNRLNGLTHLITHLKKQHGSNRSAQIAMRRLEKAVRFQNITSEMLDQEGAIDWMQTDVTAGYEDIRGPRELPDTFDPQFKLGSDEHAEWVDKAKREFE